MKNRRQSHSFIQKSRTVQYCVKSQSSQYVKFIHGLSTELDTLITIGSNLWSLMLYHRISFTHYFVPFINFRAVWFLAFIRFSPDLARLSYLLHSWNEYSFIVRIFLYRFSSSIPINILVLFVLFIFSFFVTFLFHCYWFLVV